MADLLVDGTSDYATTGTPDTATPRSDGATGSDVNSETVNGSAAACVALQTLLGNALTLKGVSTDLVARLQRLVADDGSLYQGVAFPTVPPPQEGDVFWRSDLKTVYFFNSVTQNWMTVFEGSGISSLIHGLLSGLAADDHVQYSLVDGTRQYTGDVKIKKAGPLYRLKGTEGLAVDAALQESGGLLQVVKNTVRPVLAI